MRRWVRVACVSYDPDYWSYTGRLGKNQSKRVYKNRNEARSHAEREIDSIQKLGINAKIWKPLLAHRNSGHIHIVALVTPSQFRKFFPMERFCRDSPKW